MNTTLAKVLDDMRNADPYEQITHCEVQEWADRIAEAAAALSGREAVATVCLRGETYAHGLMTELQVQHAEGVEFPIGTKFCTTPQPGDGVVVPKRATAAQLDAGVAAMLKAGIDYPSELDADAIYDAMIAAAPSAKGVA